MGRLSAKPIKVPAGVTVSVAENILSVTGPKGVLLRGMPPEVLLRVLAEDGGQMITVVPAEGAKRVSPLVGTFYVHARNMVKGVSDGFMKVLELEGIGYRAAVEGKDLVLSLGFSHPVRYTPPHGIEISVEKNEIRISGIDKELVGQAAAAIRVYRKPEPYKGKGIRYKGEHVIRKAGKKAGVGT